MGLTEENIIFVPGMLSRWVRLASGAKAHYMTSGETGPAVVLLHGGLLGASGTAGWRFMAPFLGAHGFRVYCPDMPGFGLSDDREEYWPTGVESHVDFIQDFANALCLDAFHLAGNSLGCVNTVNYLCAHPERVTSFALIAGFVGDLVPLELDKDKVRAAMAFDGSDAYMRTLMDSIVHRQEAITDDLVAMRTAAANRTAESWAKLPASIMAYAKGALRADLAARLRTRDRLDCITVPGICLYGRADALIPVEAAYKQEDALPNLQFFYPDDCGHQGQTDQPEIFNQVLLEFFRDGRVGRKTADWAGVSNRRPEIHEVVEQAATHDAV